MRKFKTNLDKLEWEWRLLCWKLNNWNWISIKANMNFSFFRCLYALQIDNNNFVPYFINLTISLVRPNEISISLIFLWHRSHWPNRVNFCVLFFPLFPLIFQLVCGLFLSLSKQLQLICDLSYIWKVIEHKPYDHKADVFSFAIVLWELLTRKVMLLAIFLFFSLIGFLLLVSIEP